MNTTTPEKPISDRAPVTTIRLATPADRDNVVSALTVGFANDVVIRWVFPDPDTYEQYAGAYFACYTDFAIEHGYVWTTGDNIGALIGMSSQAYWRAQNDAELKDRIIEATRPYAERVFAFDASLAERHPTEPEHLYLALIGLSPAHRGQSIGTLLERTGIELADQMGLPVYGEASCERNSRFHTRAGLPKHGKPIRLPDSEIDIYPLWRPLAGSEDH